MACLSLVDDPNSSSMLPSSDLYVQHLLDRVPRFEQDSQEYISNAANASIVTTAGCFASVPRVDDHRHDVAYICTEHLQQQPITPVENKCLFFYRGVRYFYIWVSGPSDF
jgi:hypothetical protein